MRGASHDLHPLGFLRLEVIGAGINQPQRLLAAIGENEAVTHDVAVEIDVGLGDRGNVGELHGGGVPGRGSVVNGTTAKGVRLSNLRPSAW